MSIDLIVYSAHDPVTSQNCVDTFLSQLGSSFKDKFQFYPCKFCSALDKDIATDYDFSVVSTFMISLIDKSAAAEVQNLKKTLKDFLGSTQTLFFMDGDLYLGG